MIYRKGAPPRRCHGFNTFLWLMALFQERFCLIIAASFTVYDCETYTGPDGYVSGYKQPEWGLGPS
jgi:hypothetical protein